MPPVINTPIVPVILSGGSGQRLWPVSRELHPKQFVNLMSGQSMLQETAERLSGAPFSAPMVVCNESHRFLVAEHLRDTGIEAAAIVLEPSRRNTAPAAALAALILMRRDPDAMMLLAPSDHVIAKPEAFLAAISIAAEAAATGRLVTFGITPDRPATGYGYIQKGDAIEGIDGCFAIDRFAEKPDAATAADYIADGSYFWNGGIFLFSAATYIETLEQLRPEMVSACQKAVDEGRDDLDFFRPDTDAFEACKGESIDYAVMENTTAGAVVPVDIGWHDVGSWESLWLISDKDDNGNVTVGDVISENVRGSYLRSEGPLIAAIGLENITVVATADAVLVGTRDAVENIKPVVEAMKEEAMKGGGRTEFLSHPRIYRPWGWFQTLDRGERHQVKHLMVKPGHGISLQAHRRRAEHWTVVAGTATVTRDDEILTLEIDQSTYIPLGAKHRLENLSAEPLSVIEVQSGDYLGEDDIVRFEDKYGRD